MIRVMKDGVACIDRIEKGSGLIECVAPPPSEAKYPPVLSGEYRDLKYRQTRLMETAKKATA